MLLLYLRGLYRTRLRALILDGLVPVVSAVSVAAMAVAMIGLFANGQPPRQADWVARLAVRAARPRPAGASRSRSPSAGRAAAGSSGGPC